MPNESTYSGEQIAVAARELRQAAGAEERNFSVSEALRMLSEEIRLLRERGFSNEKIADLLTAFDIEISESEVAHHSPQPKFAD